MDYLDYIDRFPSNAKLLDTWGTKYINLSIDFVTDILGLAKKYLTSVRIYNVVFCVKNEDGFTPYLAIEPDITIFYKGHYHSSLFETEIYPGDIQVYKSTCFNDPEYNADIKAISVNLFIDSLNRDVIILYDLKFNIIEYIDSNTVFAPIKSIFDLKAINDC